MLNELETSLRTASETIVVLQQERYKQKSSIPEALDCPWIKDRELQARLATLKSSADGLSKATTRLTLVVSKDTSEQNITSIASEMVNNVTSFMNSYLAVISCRVGNPLFHVISMGVRGELLQLLDLVTILSKNEGGNARNSRTGMVWKTSDYIQQLPLSNKAAYRRFIMERITAVKDTVTEFETYLSVAQNKANEGDQNGDIAENMDKLTMNDDNNDDDVEDDEDEDEDEDEEEAEYGVDDFTIVGESLTLIKFSLNALKAGLAIMTAVGDAYAARVEEPASVFTSLTVPTSSTTESSDVGDDVSETGTRKDGSVTFHVDHWIATVVDQSEALESAVTDFGAALYPPLDTVAKNGLIILALAWQVVVIRYLDLLQSPPSIQLAIQNHQDTGTEDRSNVIYQEATNIATLKTAILEMIGQTTSQLFVTL